MAAFDNLLTVEEKYVVLKEAARVKQAKINLEEYTRKLKAPEKVEPITSDQFLQIIINKGQQEIPTISGKSDSGFQLNEEEMKIYKMLAMYFTNDVNFEKSGLNLNKGLLLFGGLGCGKTTAMKLFSLNPNQSYSVVPCRQISKEFAKDGYIIEKYFDMQPVFNRMATFGQKETSFCFDDLGTESSAKHFGNEANVMAEIILSRYDNEVAKSRFVTHLTTNLTPDEIESYYGKRVRSRMREMFNLIEFPESISDKRK